MPSFFSRLRNRAFNHAASTATSAQVPSTTTASPPLDILPLPTSDGYQSPIDRKIIPNLADMMASYSVREEISHGLKPPRVRKPSPQPDMDSPHAEGSTSAQVVEAHVPVVPRKERRPKTSRRHVARLSRSFESVGPWATFGRHREHNSARFTRADVSPKHSRKTSAGSSMPRRSDSMNRHRTRSGQGSTTSVARHTLKSVPSSFALPSQTTSSASRTDGMHTNNPPSPQSTFSSQHNSNSFSTHHSNTSPSQSTRSPVHSVHTPLTQAFSYDSPHTFGRPSPQAHSSMVNSVSLIPPMPALDHPDLVAALSPGSRIRSQSHTSPNIAAAKFHSRHGKTYPPRRQRRTSHDNYKDNFTRHALPSFSRILRPHSSFPQAQEAVSVAASTDTTKQPSFSTSGEPSRRSSAEWSAHQATVGSHTSVPRQYGWPAEVSREILRLSFVADVTHDTNHADSHDVTQPHVPHVAAESVGNSRSEALLLSPCSPPSIIPHSLSEVRRSSILLEATGRGDPSNLSRASSDTQGVPRSMVLEDDTIEDHNDVVDTPTRSTGAFRSLTTSASKGRRTRVSRQSTPSSVTPTFKITDAGPSTFPRSSTSTRRSSYPLPARFTSESALKAVAERSVLDTPVKKGKRKAEEVDLTPPDGKTEQHATFVIPEGRHAHHLSEPPRAPSYTRKRARLSASSITASPAHSRPGSTQQQKAANTGSWTSYNSPPPASISGAASRNSTMQSTPDRRERRQSVSDISIPISALIAPRAPSVSRSSTYHMQDPRRPPRVHPTGWALSYRREDEEGSPVHAWVFFVGFILFPIWWVAAFLPIPETRRVGGTDTEKAVTLDDPQVEHDARSWRFRCRIMAVISFLTYVPFIVLVAVFVNR